MRTYGRLLAALLSAGLLLLAANARADLILGPGDAAYYGTGSGGACDGIPEPTDCDGPGTSKVLGWLDANIEGFDSSTELYKSDVLEGGGTSDSGAFDASYSTTYTNDNQDALIQWTMEGDPITDAMWLFVKDGDNDPVWYLFDISTWDGMMDIDLNGFWTGNGAISHVSIYGGGSTTVPEPGTLSLLGAALLGIGLVRRRRKFA